MLEELHNYIRFKPRKEMYTSWIGIKRFLGLKIDGAQACRLLDTTVTGSNRRNSIWKRMILIKVN